MISWHLFQVFAALSVWNIIGNIVGHQKNCSVTLVSDSYIMADEYSDVGFHEEVVETLEVMEYESVGLDTGIAP